MWAQRGWDLSECCCGWSCTEKTECERGGELATGAAVGPQRLQRSRRRRRGATGPGEGQGGRRGSGGDR